MNNWLLGFSFAIMALNALLVTINVITNITTYVQTAFGMGLLVGEILYVGAITVLLIQASKKWR